MPKAFPTGIAGIFIAQNGFVSNPIARAGGVATPLWAVGLAAVNPVAGRTVNTVSTLFTLILSNATGGAVTAWLEVGGVVITPLYNVNDNETAVITFEWGMNVGNVDVNINASANGVIAQLLGTQV